MLIKAELKEVPLCECPKFSKEELKKDIQFLAAVKICEVPRCGTVLVVDYYIREKKELQARFFTDRKSYITYIPTSDTWSDSLVINVLKPDKIKTSNSRFEIRSSSSDIKIANDFLFDHEVKTAYYMSGEYQYWDSIKIAAVVDNFIQCHKSEARQRQQDNREEKKKRHMALYPKYTDDIDDFCNRVVFPETYIFFSNLGKNRKRKCTCSRCRKTFTVAGDSAKHKAPCKCPKCASDAVYIAERYSDTIKAKNVLCTTYKHEGQLLIRFAQVTRTYGRGFIPMFDYKDFSYTLYMQENGKQRIYDYEYKFVTYGYGSYWVIEPNGYIGHHKGFVYNGNLSEVFGDKYYNVSMSSILSDQRHPIDFIKLLDNLKNLPETEYLCKLGLTNFASQISNGSLNSNGRNFREIMGVPKEYVPMYRDCGVIISEHHVISAARDYITPEKLQRFRELKIATYDYDRVEDILEFLSMESMCRYIKRQSEVIEYTDANRIVEWISDYYRMSKELEIPIDKRSARPKDIREAHDLLLPRYTQVRDERQEQASKRALAFINEQFREYSSDGMCIVLPRLRSDFIREGQILSHCVGMQRYYDNHIAGTRMIFFIRKSDSPNTPYFTCEIDMTSLQVLQLYGHGDCIAPKDVKDFSRSFVEKVLKKELRKAG